MIKRLFILIALIGTLIPTLFVLDNVGGIKNWQSILPAGQTDSLYYYARIHEVVDGYPLIGNPYYYEHRDALAPGFFLPDIMSAIPTFLGLPFDIATIVNMFVWSFVFLMLTFTLLRLFDLPTRWALAGTVLTYIMAFTFIIRPTSLQLIYPIFLSFLILLIKFLNNPLERRRVVHIMLITVLSFYTYTLLAYIIGLTLAFTLLWYLYNQRFEEVRIFFIHSLLAILLLIPFGFISVAQLNNPYYLETFSRMGLVFTHVPEAEVYYFGRWIIIGLVGLILLWLSFPKKETENSERKIFWLVTGAGLSGGLVLNIFTGVDVALAIHTGRFIFVWLTILLTVLMYEWHTARIPIVNDINTRIIRLWLVKSIVAICIAVLIICVIRNTPPGPSFFKKVRKENISEKQEYAPPLDWIETNIQEPSVIWANESISAHIPIMTKHYVLFHRDAALHFLPSTEQEDRYLLSHNMDDLTMEELKNDLISYTGHGLYLQSFYQNRDSKYCETLSHFGFSINCPSPTTPDKLKGEEYFKKLEQRFDYIRKNRSFFLNKYHIGYRIIDKDHDSYKNISSDTVLYDNGRFVIISVALLNMTGVE